MASLKTTLVWEVGDAEQEADVTVSYTVRKGYDGGSHAIDPPEPASVEITEILQHGFGPNVPERFFEDDDLLAECWQDYVEDMEAATEAKAEARREDRWS